MSSVSQRRAMLRSLIAQGRPLVIPGAYDAVSARLVERAGFPVAYVGSYATAASGFGLPDVGLIGMQEMAAYAGAVACAVSVPVLADAENGFNNAANIWRTVRAFEQVGVAGIHIEDHEFGKHAPVRQVLLPLDQMVGKVRAALDSREDPNFLIIARTDAMWALDDPEETVRRANAFGDAGSDMVLLAACPPDRLSQVRGDIRPKVMVTSAPGRMVQAELDAGADAVLCYGLCLYAAYEGVKRALAAFKADTQAGELDALAECAAEFEAFTGVDEFVARARQYRLA